MIQRRRKWVVYEQGWRQTYKQKYCESCQRTWPKATCMYFMHGRWEYKGRKSDHLYIWLCPVCRKFAVGHKGWDDEMIPKMCISLCRNARKPWWRLYPDSYIRVESKHGLEVLSAGLVPACLLARRFKFPRPKSL